MINQTPIVVQAADAELLAGRNPMRLLADSDASEGAFSISSGTIAAGADNAKPHFHKASWEVFCIIDGTLEMLLDDELVTVGGGGLVAVPPGVVHAFGATSDSPVSAFVFITPGVNRFDYFRVLPKILRGEIPEQELAEMHRTYDVHFTESPLWDQRGHRPT
ncbi:cupin domain-containing protein [Microlunatus parietis]|uniref:Mannose-6-phosphate isomerase-like protein (Cupin superfamily) n=1 Tax=Microlunatus parietis TaxID=682979 RepID=A0A7Y9ICN5_9ACTN|nr:cupin domain-containing protein [Microlunatus parietis]NYE74168.1 mannose-6-phosphate isomerase-like protein (cupin superfamily) [Microlunatus parietis]